MRTRMITRDINPLYEAGYDLIPLKGKRPITKNWVASPRTTLAVLTQQLKTKADNVGIRLGRPLEDGRYLCVIDVDVLDKLTVDDVTDLNDALIDVTGGVDVSNGPQVTTGFGHTSRHIYVATNEMPRKALLAKADRIVEYTKAGIVKQGPVWKIELMGYGAQCVIPPSIHPDTNKSYQWTRKLNGADDIPTVELSLVSQQKQLVSEGPTEITQIVTDGLDVISPYYRDLLINGDTEGKYASRSEAVYAVMSVLVRDTEFTDDQIAEVIVDIKHVIGDKPREFNDSKGWVVKQLGKLRSAHNDVKIDVAPSELKGYVKEVQDRHALVLWGGKPAIFRQRKNPPHWESRYDIMTPTALGVCYENKLVKVGDKMLNPVDIWRSSPNRREYLEGAMMAPGDTPLSEGYFNLWQGYSVKPVQGSVKLFTDFIGDVICNGHKEHTKWLLDWVADLFQHTGDPKGVAIVLRGAEGIGKGTFASALGYIVGAHFRHITQESQMTGRFNAHFADSTLVFGDEMTWGGDKRHRGVLYSLITERLLMVERKNFDAVSMRNLNRLIIASNNDWVIPTNIDGRRWFVLDPSKNRKLDTAYFKDIQVWLSSDGYSKLLFYFQHRKITSDLRKAPTTQGLIDQKVNALDPVHQWWFECLDRGSISPVLGSTPTKWPQDCRIAKERLYDFYLDYCKERSMRIPIMSQFMRALVAVTPVLEEIRTRTEEGRVRVVVLPELKEATQYFQGLLES